MTGEVFEASAAAGSKLLILLALAEKASNDDGVAFGIDQGWPKGERSERRRRQTIAGRAKVHPGTVSRLIAELCRDDELEVRWVRQRQARWAVYRIMVGDYRDREVDTDFLARHGQLLDRPFSTVDELRLPWPERPGNSPEVPHDLRGSSGLEVPHDLRGSFGGDYLTSGEVPPHDLRGGYLTNREVALSIGTVQEHGPHSVGARAARADVCVELSGVLDEQFGQVPETARGAARRRELVDELAELGATGGSVRYAVERWARERTVRLTADALVRHYPELTVGFAAAPAAAAAAGPVDLRARLRAAAAGLDLAAGVCPECEVGGGRHAVDCGAIRETPLRACRRFVDEIAADPAEPLDELHAIIDSEWGEHGLDDVDRQELHDRADRVRGEAVTPRLPLDADGDESRAA